MSKPYSAGQPWQVIKDERQGAHHGSAQSQTSAPEPTTTGERHAKEGHQGGKEGSGGKASRHAVELR